MQFQNIGAEYPCIQKQLRRRVASSSSVEHSHTTAPHDRALERQKSETTKENMKMTPNDKKKRRSGLYDCSVVIDQLSIDLRHDGDD